LKDSHWKQQYFFSLIGRVLVVITAEAVEGVAAVEVVEWSEAVAAVEGGGAAFWVALFWVVGFWVALSWVGAEFMVTDLGNVNDVYGDRSAL
jgi:hypothetical protein